MSTDMPHFVRGDAYVEKGEYQKAVKELSLGC